MTKKGWIILAIIIVVIIGGIIGSAVAISKIVNNIAGKEKTVISASKFEEIMEENQFTVIDSKYQFENYEYVEEARIAIENDANYQIEFYVIDSDKAEDFYNSNKEIFENEISNKSSKSTQSMTFKNGKFYKAETSDKFIYLSRVENTIVYIHADSEYKDNINKMIEKLGY